jgi:serine protease inhibitor
MSKILHPNDLEIKTLSLWLPQFSIKSRLTLKSLLSQKPELAEYFSELADYSKMAKEKIQVGEIYHQVIFEAIYSRKKHFIYSTGSLQSFTDLD